MRQIEGGVARTTVGYIWKPGKLARELLHPREIADATAAREESLPQDEQQLKAV